tara:strand:+ start:1229 stop:1579 length:351 start_codon:yes stop_codon:yes gene_type:complete
MKVGISYAVELEDIPEEVENLLRDVQWDLVGILEEILKDIHVRDFSGVFGDINNLRKEAQKLDTRLEDCYNILAGYAKIRQQLIEQAQATSQAEVTELGPGRKIISAVTSEDEAND